MEAQQFNIDNIANNLANANTVGFKRGRGDFQDLLYQTLRPAGAASSSGTEVPTGIQIGHGVRPVAVQKLFHTGSFSNTDNPLDLAIEGKGFFAVTTPNGETAYTRAGSFKLDSNGRIVTSDGFPLEPEITIPNDTVSFTVGTDGTLSALAYRKEPLHCLGGLRRCADRYARPRGSWNHRPRDVGTVQRQRRGRDGEHDFGTKGL
jgi:flagellar basal-body rod protein FlgG